jgi:hypothetical protein
MKQLPEFNASTLEMVLFALFVAYLVFRPESPPAMTHFVDTPIGMALVVAVTAYMFLYTHPILGILSIFVAYEIVRRNNNMTLSMVQYREVETPKFDEPPTVSEERTLEEDMVAEHAPLHTDVSLGLPSYKPVAEHVHNASILD